MIFGAVDRAILSAWHVPFSFPPSECILQNQLVYHLLSQVFSHHLVSGGSYIWLWSQQWLKLVIRSLGSDTPEVVYLLHYAIWNPGSFFVFAHPAILSIL